MTSLMKHSSGFCAPGFEAVREAFERNFDHHGEIGAAVSVCLDGKPVVDLWGGVPDSESGRTWREETAVVVFSCTKGAGRTMPAYGV